MNEKYKNATIVDVRTVAEFRGEHYPNAIHIPINEVEQRINEFKEMSKPIIAYCRSGHRSETAVTILHNHGIEEAINAGGLQELIRLLRNIEH